MKKKAKMIEFQIPDPCSESWNKMQALPGGRFCDSCEKTLVDFSQMTDNELTRFFIKNDKKICGRFRGDQLNKKMEIPKAPSSIQKWNAAAAVAVGLMTWNNSSAQTPEPVLIGEVAPMISQSETEKGEKCQLEKPNLEKGKYKLKGIVKDQNGEVLIGANVLLQENKGVTTDMDGKFELEIPMEWESFEVTFSYLGYSTQVIDFDKQEVQKGKAVEIKMQETSVKLETLEVVAKPPIYRTHILGIMVPVEHPPKKIKNKDKKKIEVVKDKIENISFSKIYPNPFVDLVNVELKVGKAAAYLLHLYDMNGQLIWARTFEVTEGEQQLQLDFSSVEMSEGSYFLRITDGSREIQTKKIIKVNETGNAEHIIQSSKQ